LRIGQSLRFGFEWENTLQALEGINGSDTHRREGGKENAQNEMDDRP
jgi:hypothetical protein